MNPDFSNQRCIDDSDTSRWDAFRYVANEMSADEETAFEAELGVNQPLREQVASIVSSMAVVEASLAEMRGKVANRRSGLNYSRRLRAFSMAATVAAVVLIAAWLTWPAPQGDSDLDLIAGTWAESMDASEFVLAEPLVPEFFDSALLDFDSDDAWIAEVVTAVSEPVDAIN